jgi:hypothetical protein
VQHEYFKQWNYAGISSGGWLYGISLTPYDPNLLHMSGIAHCFQFSHTFIYPA